MPNEILDQTKELLGIPAEENSFDSGLVIYINEALTTLNDLGVGIDGYRTTVTNGSFDNFLPEVEIHDRLQMYIFLKVRLSFDPPTSSFVLSAMEKKVDELEGRLLDFNTT